jgi:TM2 domain-containing membrane protein YozV
MNAPDPDTNTNTNTNTNTSTNTNTYTNAKSYVVTVLLCFFLGCFGAHRFYVGKIGTAVLMLLTLGGFGIWAIVDLIVIIICDFEDANGFSILPRRNA